MENFGKRIRAAVGAATALLGAAGTARAENAPLPTTDPEAITRVEMRGMVGHPHQKFASPTSVAVVDALPRAPIPNTESVADIPNNRFALRDQSFSTEPVAVVVKDSTRRASRPAVGAPVSLTEKNPITYGIGDGIEITRGNTQISISGDEDGGEFEVVTKF